MTTTRRPMLLPFCVLLALGGCDCGDDDATPHDAAMFPEGSVFEDGRVILPDGNIIVADSGPAPDAGPPVDSGPTPDAGPPPRMDAGPIDGGPCIPATCEGHTYQCGDCLDNDGDGRADSRDPDCLGPCFNDESLYFPDIPGGDSPTCLRDCYYDQDQGPGNDHCAWDSRCDPLSPDSRAMCAFEDPPPPSAQCPDPQDPACHEFCDPLTPNGCDCFGCCTFDALDGRPRAMGGESVFVGTLDADGNATCSLDTVEDVALCHPCTPVTDCYNPCGHCELCIGRTMLPDDCFPPPPMDGGMPIDAGPPRDGAPPPVDGGPPPPPRCDPGVQACGLPGDPACPAGWYCLTGCCIFFG